MPDDISIKLKLDGEREFNAGLKACNNELKAMSSEVKAVDAANKGAANSEQALTEKVNALGKASDAAKQKVDYLNQVVAKQKAAQDAAAKALQEAKKNYDENSKEVEEAQAAYNNITNSVNKWTEKLNKAKVEQANIDEELSKSRGYLKEAQTSTDGLATSIDEYGKEVNDADTETKDLQKTLAQTGAAEAMQKVCDMLANSIGKIGEKALDAAKELDKGYDTIVEKTGATGDTLQDLKGVANDIFGELPEDMENVSIAIGEVNTRFGKTGKGLKDLSTEFLKFSKINKTDLNSSIDKTDRILTQFNRSTDEAAKLLGMMSKRSQETGRDTSKLMDNLADNAGVLKMFGFTLEESVNFLARLEDNGVEASTALAGLKKAAAEYTKNGQSMRDGIELTIESIKNAATEQEAWSIAQETFGTKGFTTMATAIREGKVDIDDLTDSLSNYETVVSDTYDATLSGWDKMTVATNKLKTIGSELTEDFYNAVAPAMDFVGNALQGLLDLFHSLPEEAQNVIAVIGGIGAIAAKILPNIINFTTQLATLKVMEEITGQTSGLTRGLTKLKGGFKSMGSGAAAAAAVVAGVAVAFAAVSDAAKQLSEDQQKLADKTKSTKDAYDTTKDSIRDLKETIDSYATTQEKRAAIEDRIAEVQETQRQAQRTYNDSLITGETAIKTFDDALNGELDTWGQLLDGLTNGAVRMLAVSQSADALKAANQGSNEVIEQTNADLTELNEMLAAVEAEEKANAETIVNASGEIVAAKDASISKVGEELAAWNNLDSNTRTVAENVALVVGNMKDAIQAGVESVGNFFDAVAEKTTYQAETMKKNFRDQIEALKIWEQDLAYLGNKGINQEFLTYLANMGPSASGYVTAMKEDVLAGGQATVDEWNALYREKLDLEGAFNEEGNNLLTAIGELAAGSKEQFEAMATELNAATNANGQFIVAGMVDGIKAAMDEAEKAGEELGEETVDGVAKGAQTHSPSKATLATGKNIDQGLINGLNALKSSVGAKGREVANFAIQAMKNANAPQQAQNLGSQISQGFARGITLQQATATAAAAALIAATSQALRDKAQTLYQAAISIIQSISNGITAGVNMGRTSAFNAGASLANQLAAGLNASSAVQTAYSLAASVSAAAATTDSSGAYWAGYAISHGMAQGINAGASAAINAAIQMATRALQAAKKTLGIASPSKVWEEEVGVMSALGFAKGFNKTVDIQADKMVTTVQNGLPDLGQYSAQAPPVYVYLGDKELTTYMTRGVVQNIQGGVRAYGAAGGRNV